MIYILERQAHGFVIVFDFTNRATFESVDKWIRLLRVHATMEQPPIVVLGNKKDLEDK
jgi:GTPase SAR1 family protein